MALCMTLKVLNEIADSMHFGHFSCIAMCKHVCKHANKLICRLTDLRMFISAKIL